MRTKNVALMALAFGAAGAVHAQTVTLYGILDAFVQYANGADSVTRIQGGGLNGSRLGFRGTEDLGGGMRALFTLETGISNDTGTVAQGGVFWGRQVFVGLGSPLGTLTLGRQYGSVYNATSDFSVFSNGSYGASTAVIGGFGTYEPVRGAGDDTGSSTGIGGPARVNNSVKYESPSWSGFKFGGLVGSGEQSDSFFDNRTYDLYARYTAGPLDAIVSYMDDKSAVVARDAKTLTLGATFSFGAFRVVGGYLQTDDKSAANADGKGYWIGGDYRFGTVQTVRAQYVANQPDAADIDSQAFGVGYQYDFSKRTALYTSVTYFKNENRARWHGSVPEGLATPTDSDITEFVLGIRHSF